MFTRNKSKVQNFTTVSETETPKFKKLFENRRNVICFCCNKSGHVAKSCPEIRKGNKLKPKEDIYKAKMSIEIKALNVSDISEEDPNIWYLDSEATKHMTLYLNKMKNFKNIVSSVKIANKLIIQVEGKDDTTVEFSEEKVDYVLILLMSSMFLI